MKLSTLVLMCAGLAIAKKSGDKGQNAEQDANNGTDAAANNGTNVAANNGTDSANIASNSTNVSNSTDSGNNNGNNTSNNNGSNVVQLQNGSPCINGAALSNVNAQDINLAGLNLGLLNLGSVNLGDQLAVADGILALMNSFCLSQAVDLNALLGLGLNDQVDMFLELAQLAQLESLGFLNVFGVQNLLQSNLVFNNNQLDVLNVASLKREVARIKPTLKRTVARRDVNTRKRLNNQCGLGSVLAGQNLPLCDNGNNNNNNNNKDDNKNDNNNNKKNKGDKNKGNQQDNQNDKANGQDADQNDNAQDNQGSAQQQDQQQQ